MNIDTMTSIALAVAAYNQNGKQYLKEDLWDNEVVKIKTFSNRNILRANLDVDYYSSDTKPTDRPPMLNVTGDDMAEAVKIRDYTRKSLLKLLALQPGEQPTYEVSLYQKLNQAEIHPGDLGFVASAPMYYYNNMQRDNISKRLEEMDSQHVGTLGGKVTLENLEVVRNSYSKTYSGHVIMGISENNLFLFFSSKDLKAISVGDTISINGRIKDHILEKDKYPMTKLHYVNIKGMENAPTITPRTNNHSDLF